MEGTFDPHPWRQEARKGFNRGSHDICSTSDLVIQVGEWNFKIDYSTRACGKVTRMHSGVVPLQVDAALLDAQMLGANDG